jgi:putative glutamine amidotransferase
VKPLIGISCCIKQFGTSTMPNHAASDTYVRAIDQVVHGVPVLIPASGTAACVETLLDRLDGMVLTGSRSNVQPSLYGGPPHPEGVHEDPARDAATLPLIRAAVARGVPVLAICRGLQELNVALGGSLHQRLQDVPGKLDHSSLMHPLPQVTRGKAHAVRVANAPGFAVGVQWHPEYDFPTDAVSRRIFEAFGEAVWARIRVAAAAAD